MACTRPSSVAGRYAQGSRAIAPKISCHQSGVHSGVVAFQRTAWLLGSRPGNGNPIGSKLGRQSPRGAATPRPPVHQQPSRNGSSRLGLLEALRNPEIGRSDGDRESDNLSPFRIGRTPRTGSDSVDALQPRIGSQSLSRVSLRTGLHGARQQEIDQGAEQAATNLQIDPLNHSRRLCRFRTAVAR